MPHSTLPVDPTPNMDSLPPRLTFGRYIRHLRETHLPKWTQDDLVRASGLGSGTISKIENDQTNRTQVTTQSLAEAFGMTVAALESGYQRFSGGSPDPQPDTPMRRITDKGIDPVVVRLAERIMRLPRLARFALEAALNAFEELEDDGARPQK